MEHEVLNLKSKCNCRLEFDDIAHAVVLIYKNSVDIYYQHKTDKISVSCLPGKKCLAMLSTTADYLMFKKKGKKLTFYQGYKYGEYTCYEKIKVKFKNNDIDVKRERDVETEKKIDRLEGWSHEDDDYNFVPDFEKDALDIHEEGEEYDERE